MESRSRAGKVLLWSCLGKEATLVALLNPFFLTKKKKELEHSIVLRKKQKYERFCAIFLFQYMGNSKSKTHTHTEEKCEIQTLIWGKRDK